MSFEQVEAAIDAVRRGEFVVVVDDEDRENEGDLIIAAEKMTPEKMAFMIRYTSGVICLPLEGARLDELQLPLMVAGPENSEQQRTAFTVSVDAKLGTTTGISAADRSTDGPRADRPDRRAPRTSPGPGTSSRCATATAACSSARVTPKPRSTSPAWPAAYPAGVLAEIVNDDGTMQRLPDLQAFADEHGLVLVTIADLIRYRRHREKLVRRVSEARIPTRARRLHRARVRVAARRHRAPGVRAGRGGGRRERPRARALRVPHRRRVRIAPLRLRHAARPRARTRRGRRRRRGRVPARPRGPRHRPRPQAARLLVAGRRPRHRRGQHRPRLPARLA